jgi:hypothetical protein
LTITIEHGMLFLIGVLQWAYQHKMSELKEFLGEPHEWVVAKYILVCASISSFPSELSLKPDISLGKVSAKEYRQAAYDR